MSTKKNWRGRRASTLLQKEQIGEQPKPDLEAIMQKREEAENQLQNLRNEQEQWNQYTRTDCAAYDILKPKGKPCADSGAASADQ